MVFVYKISTNIISKDKKVFVAKIQATAFQASLIGLSLLKKNYEAKLYSGVV